VVAVRRLVPGFVLLAVVAGCARPGAQAAPADPVPAAQPLASPTGAPSLPPAVSGLSAARPASPSAPPGRPRPTRTLVKPSSSGVDGGGSRYGKPTADGVPTHAAGTFTVAPGGTDVVGSGTTLVKYRVEVEDGIDFGSNPAWTPASFAGTVDQIIAAPRGWTRSAQAPVTDPAQHLANASWSFQRVSGTDFSVRIRLATPDTVDKLCGSMGMDTQGVYSCRYGQTEMINLRRWLRGAPGFPISLDGYHTMVIDHEMGHFLGFDHMKCPGPGHAAPVMQEQTIDLAGCTINPYPYADDGTFVTGPWAAS
jgi:Protein of unknown function (DUF3152)